MADEILSTAQAAERLGISTRRVRALIEIGRLPAIQLGREYAIRAADLAAVRERKPGRPPTRPDTAQS